MIKWLFTFFCFLSIITISRAQIDVGLVAYFSFDDCTANESRNDPAVQTILNSPLTCECGVSGKSLRFGGFPNDHFFVAGPVNGEFDREDFTISLYFKPTGEAGAQTLLYQASDDCPNQAVFAIRYDGNPSTRYLNIQLVENSNQSGSIARYSMPEESCWHHIVVVRKNTRTSLYVNGKLATETTAPSRVNIKNTGVLTFGKSYCSASDRNFKGLMDEVRIYNRALNSEDIESLYVAPDKILTNDTRLFLGESLNVDIGQTCADSYEWTPATGVDDVNDPNSLISPTESTTYRLTFKDADGLCNAYDTIRVLVIDPNTLDCAQVFVPNAFTPNGDGINERFGISNPEIFTFGGAKLESFEIYDRWGNLVFYTETPGETWDGYYKSKAVNPGVYLFKVRYACDNEEKVESGSITVIR